jgi:Lipopolysaccharide-assembly
VSRATAVPVLLAAGLAMLQSACGYTFGSGLPAQGIHTVHLKVVANETWRQRLEVQLGAALSRELYATSDLEPADAEAADAILEVVLQDERERTLVTGDRTDPVREGAQEAVVRMRLVARRTGRVLIDRPILDRVEFRSPIGENLASAGSELVSDLARKIALALETRF